MMTKKTTRRFVAGLLAFLMVFTGLPFGIFEVPTAQAAPGDSEATAIVLTNEMKDGMIPTDLVDIDRKHAISGRTWVDYGGLLAEYNGKDKEVDPADWVKNSDVALPNAKLFLQWMDEDGSLSPIYTFTSNNLGAYMVRPGYYDTYTPGGVMTRHKFMEWKGGFEVNHYPKIKIWADGAWTTEHNLNIVADPSFGNFGGILDNPSPYGATWKKDAANVQIVNAGVAFQYRDTLTQHLPKGQRVVQVTANQDYNTDNASLGGNDFLGNIYWDLGYVYNRTATPTYDASTGDIYAKDIPVLLSVAKKDGTVLRTYETKTNSYGDFRFDIKDLAAGNLFFGKDLQMSLSVDLPNNVGVWTNTVIGKFSTGGPGTTETVNGWNGLYGNNRVSGTGDLGQRYDATLYSYNDKATIKQNRGFGFQFILRPQHQTFEVNPYDDTANYASPGDTANASGGGYVPDIGVKYSIVWYDDEHKEVGRTDDVEVRADGVLIKKVNGVEQPAASTFTVPTDLAKDTRYRAELKNTGTARILAVDTFLVTVLPDAPTYVRIALDEGTPEAPEGDGIITAAEKGTATTTDALVGLPVNVEVGDKVQVDANGDGIYEHEVVVTAGMIEAGVVTVKDIPLPAEGQELKVVAKIADKVSGKSKQETFTNPEGEIEMRDLTKEDTALINTAGPEAPVLADPIKANDKTVTVTVKEGKGIVNVYKEGTADPIGTATVPEAGGDVVVALNDGVTLAKDDKLTAVHANELGNPSDPSNVVTVVDPQPSRLPIDLKQDVKKDANGTQILTGKVDAFTPGEATMGWEVKLTDKDGNVLKYTDPMDNQEKEVIGKVNTDGTFEFNIENKGLIHDQEVKVQLTEPEKMPTLSTEVVKLDLQGPVVTEVAPVVNEGTIEITAKVDDPEAGYVIQIGTKTYPATVDEKGNLTAEINAADPGDIKIIGVDKLGNMSTTDVERPTAEAVNKMAIHVFSIYGGNRRVSVYTERPSALVTYKVVRAGAVLQEGTFTTSKVGRANVTLDNNARFAIGDKLFIEASATSEGKLYKTDPLIVQVTQ